MSGNGGGREGHVRDLLLLLVFCYLATALGLSKIYLKMSADHVIPVFISLVKWTPFFWEADRFGSVLPLLFSPIHGFAENLFCQTIACYILLFIAIDFLVHCCVGQRQPLVSLASVLLLLAVFGNGYLFYHYGSDFPYGQGLGFFGLGFYLFLYESPGEGPARRFVRQALGLLCVTSSLWICLNLLPALCILLGFFAFGETRRAGRSRYAWLAAVAVISFVAVFFFLRRLSPSFSPARYGLLAPTDWPGGAIALLKNAWPYFFTTWQAKAFVGTGLLAAALSLIRADTRAVCLRGALTFALLLGADLAMAASNAWVAINRFEGRYLFLSTTFLLVYLAVSLLSPVARFFPRVAAVCVGAALLWAIVTNPPRYAAARASTILPHMAEANELAASGCTLVAGDFWRTWPVVFAANVINDGYGASEPILDISHRSGEIKDIIDGRIRRCALVATLVADSPAAAQTYLAAYQITVAPLGQFSRITVFDVTGLDGKPLACDRSRYFDETRAEFLRRSGAEASGGSSGKP